MLTTPINLLFFYTEGIIFLGSLYRPPLSDQDFKQPICVQEHLVASWMRKYWVYLLACGQKQVRCLEVSRLQLGLEDSGIKLTSPGKAACQLWDSALPVPTSSCASSSQIIMQSLSGSISLLHWNSSSFGVRNGRNTTEMH